MLATNQATIQSNLLQSTTVSVITAGQPIGDCSIRVYRSFYYTKEYHTGYFPLCCYYDQYFNVLCHAAVGPPPQLVPPDHLRQIMLL